MMQDTQISDAGTAFRNTYENAMRYATFSTVFSFSHLIDQSTGKGLLGYDLHCEEAPAT